MSGVKNSYSMKKKNETSCVSMNVYYDHEVYRVINEECHSFRELICHVMQMKKSSYEYGSDSQYFRRKLCMSSEMLWNLWIALSWPTFCVRWACRGQLILGNPFSNWQYDGLACGLYLGLPDWAISSELGYPRGLLATDFDS